VPVLSLVSVVPYCPFVPGAASTQELQPGNIVAQRGEGMAGWEALRMGYSTFPSSSSSLSHSPSTAVPAPKHSSCRCSRARKGDTAGPSIPRTRLHQSAHQHPIPSHPLPSPTLTSAQRERGYRSSTSSPCVTAATVPRTWAGQRCSLDKHALAAEAAVL
jgi:hypothetical protein